MNFFNYNNGKANLGKVWTLFTDLASANREASVNNTSSEFSHTVDIVNAAFSGSISLEGDSAENFNLIGYEYSCKINDKLTRRASTDKELFIVDEYQESDSDTGIGFGDISARKLGSRDENLNRVIESSSFDSALSDLLGIRKELIISEGIDIVTSMREALDGVSSAIEAIKDLYERNNKVRAIVSELYENGYDLSKRLASIG